MAAGSIVAVPDMRVLSRVLLRRRATTPFELLVVGVWIGVLVWGLVAASNHGGSGMAAEDMASMPGMRMSLGGSGSSSALSEMPMWGAMVFAMMVPASLPGVAYVGLHSFRRRRGRAMAQYVMLGWLGWMLFGAVCFGTFALAGLGRLNSRYALAGLVALAAGWQLTSAKRTALWRCHRTVPLPTTGAAAAAGVARFSWITTTGCVGSCWLMMVAMAAAPMGRMLVLMPVTTAVGTAERLAARPRRTARIGAGVLAFTALTLLL
jgi:predicted metal-binding membrane protein